MRHFFILAGLLSLFGSISTRATITYLRVNGVDSNYTMAQGDTLTWEADCDSGTGLRCEVWVDLNENGVIEEGTDKAWQKGFTHTDGDTMGDGGPPDMDGTVNGVVYLKMVLGLAPAKWILRFTDMTDTSTVTHAGTVTPMLNPFRVITGTVSGPAGFNPGNLIIGFEDKDHGSMWMALTDSTGTYYLNTDSALSEGDTLEIDPDDVDRYVTPASQVVVLGATDTIYNVDFTYSNPLAYVYGWVKDDLDSILTGDNIYLWTQLDGQNQDSRNTQPDSSGFFMFFFGPNDTGKTWRFGMHVEGTLPDHMEAPGATFMVNNGDSTNLDFIALYADTVITGTVTEDGGAPSKAYEIEFRTDAGSHKAMSDDSSGVYSIPVSSTCGQGNVRINIEGDDGTPLPDGYAIEGGNYKSAGPGDVVNFNLILGGMVTGKVCAEDSTPLANINVDVHDWKWQDSYNGTTDSAGNFTITGIPPGDYRVDAHSGNGYVGEWYNDTQSDWDADSITLVGGDTVSNIDFYLAKGAYIIGSVKAESDSQPINNCGVQAGPADRGTNYWSNTNISGYYEMIVAPGSYFVQVNNPPNNYASEEYNNRMLGSRLDTVTVGVGDTVSGVDFYLALGGVISGMVRLAADSSAFKDGYLQLRDAGMKHVTNAYQNDSGFYEITGVAPGSYYLWASGGDWKYNLLNEYWDNAHDSADADLIVISGGDTAVADFYMDARPVLYGQITSDSSGNTQGLGNVELFLWEVTNDTQYIKQTWTDSAGNYSFSDNLDPGQYKLQIMDHSNNYTDEYYPDAAGFTGADTITLAAGESLQVDEGLDIARGAITGKVERSSDHSGIEGLTMFAYPQNGDDPADSVMTDSNGDFMFTGLPAQQNFHVLAYGIDQDYQLEWYNNSLTRNNASGIWLSNGDTSSNINFSLDTGAVVRGSVFAAIDTSGIAGAEVGVFLTSNNQEYRSVITDGSGAFEIRGVPSGNYKLEAQAGSQGYGIEWWDSKATYNNADWFNVSAPSDTGGFDFYLDASGSLSGYVYSDAPGSAAVAGLEVQVYNESRDYVSKAVTDGAGHYTLEGLVPGIYFLQAQDQQWHFGEWYDNVGNDSSHLADSAVLVNPADSGGFDFYLTPASSVELRIFRACDSLSLYIQREMRLISVARGDTQTQTYSGDQHTWYYCQAGDYIVELTAPAYVDPDPETLTLAAGEAGQAYFYLRPALVINEIRYDGGNAEDDTATNPEFVELYALEDVNLQNWQLQDRDGSNWNLNYDTLVAAGEYVVVSFKTGQDTTFGGVHYLYMPGTDLLRDDGGYLGLQDPNGNRTDVVVYEGGLPWGIGSDEFCGWPNNGSMPTDSGAVALDTIWSISLIPDGDDWNNGTNWYNSVVTAGAANQRATYCSETVSGTGPYYFGNLGIKIQVLSLTGSDIITVTVHPDSFPGNLPGGDPIKRYFNIEAGSGITAITAVLTFTYDQAEFNASNILDEGTVYAARWSGSEWVQYLSVVDTKSNTVRCTTTVFSPWGLGGDGGPVPVELSTFTALAVNGTVQLQWRTETEENNLGFNVYRNTLDGQGFVRINPALIPGAGNSNQPQGYTFTDLGLPAGGGEVSYYLEQVDINGLTTRSEVISILVPTGLKQPEPGGADRIIAEIRPRPFKDRMEITLHLPGLYPGKMSLFAVNGSLVRELAPQATGPDCFRYTWDGKDTRGKTAANGLYGYRLQLDGKEITGTLTLVK